MPQFKVAGAGAITVGDVVFMANSILTGTSSVVEK